MAGWEPFDLDADERSAYAVLVDGVPTWMREGVLGWLRTYILESSGWTNVAFCIRLQTASRIDLSLHANRNVQGHYTMEVLRSLPERALLRVVDYVLADKTGYDQSSQQKLEAVLLSGRSKWTIGERMGRPGLVERVPAGVQTAVEQPLTPRDWRAGSLLRHGPTYMGWSQIPAAPTRAPSELRRSPPLRLCSRRSTMQRWAQSSVK